MNSITDAGTAGQPRDYDPFGIELTASDEPNPADATAPLAEDSLGYLGAHLRPGVYGSNLIHMGARVYDPSAGRFLSRDPVLGDDANPQTQNPYAYGLNSPGRYYDLDGRSASSVLEDFDRRLTKPLEDAANDLIDAAERATRYYQDVIDDPNANWAEKLGARVGNFLTKDVACMSPEDLGWTIVGGRGGRGGGARGIPKSGSRGSARLTNAQAKQLADYLGFKPTGLYSEGQAVFRKGNRYISHDFTNHAGGVWKMAKSPKALKSKSTRMGTYDENLKRIGD